MAGTFTEIISRQENTVPKTYPRFVVTKDEDGLWQTTFYTYDSPQAGRFLAVSYSAEAAWKYVSTMMEYGATLERYGVIPQFTNPAY